MGKPKKMIAKSNQTDIDKLNSIMLSLQSSLESDELPTNSELDKLLLDGDMDLKHFKTISEEAKKFMSKLMASPSFKKSVYESKRLTILFDISGSMTYICPMAIFMALCYIHLYFNLDVREPLRLNYIGDRMLPTELIDHNTTIDQLYDILYEKYGFNSGTSFSEPITQLLPLLPEDYFIVITDGEISMQDAGRRDGLSDYQALMTISSATTLYFIGHWGNQIKREINISLDDYIKRLKKYDIPMSILMKERHFEVNLDNPNWISPFIKGINLPIDEIVNIYNEMQKRYY